MNPMRHSDSREFRHVPDVRQGVSAWFGVVGGGGVILLAYLVGVVWRVGRRIDDRALRLAQRVGARVVPEVHAVLAYLAPMMVAVGVVAVVARSVQGGDRLRAANAVALVVGSELVAQGLKLLLPRLGGGTNTLPSGHMTMIAASVLVLAIVGQWRRIRITLGVLVVVGSAVGTWVIGWHRPSDTLAACGVVALCWGATRLITDAIRPAMPGAPRGPDDRPTVPSMRAVAQARPPGR